MLTHHDLKHVGQTAVLLRSTSLPQVSNLWGHLQRGRFSFKFWSCHVESFSVNLYISNGHTLTASQILIFVRRFIALLLPLKLGQSCLYVGFVQQNNLLRLWRTGLL